jgi:hypothetical protein
MLRDYRPQEKKNKYRKSLNAKITTGVGNKNNKNKNFSTSIS